MLNFSFQTWQMEISKNPSLQKSSHDLLRSFVSIAQSKVFQVKKNNSKKAFDNLLNNDVLNEKFSNLQTRLADQAHDETIQKHLNDFELGIAILSEHPSLQEEFIKFQIKLNQVGEVNFNEEVVQLRETIFDHIKASQSILLPQDKSKIPSIIFHILLSLVYINFWNLQQSQNIASIYLDYINNISTNVIAISRINLRDQPNLESESIGIIQKNSILKCIKDENSSLWAKVVTDIDGQELSGFVPTAYIKPFKG